MKKKNVLIHDWLNDPSFKEWLEKVPEHPTKAHCSACKVQIKKFHLHFTVYSVTCRIFLRLIFCFVFF